MYAKLVSQFKPNEYAKYLKYKMCTDLLVKYMKYIRFTLMNANKTVLIKHVSGVNSRRDSVRDRMSTNV